MLAHVGDSLTPPTSLRSNGIEPYARSSTVADLVATAVAEATTPQFSGLTGIVVPDSLFEETSRSVADLDAASLGIDELPRVHTVTTCKGLEFDTTVVVEPSALIEQSPRGYSDLYVALTRSTQRLVVVNADSLPAELADLPQR